jgi:hypothetical protein
MNPFGYDPKTAFGDMDLIDRLKKAHRKKTEKGGTCPECRGKAHIIVKGKLAECTMCHGKGIV